MNPDSIFQLFENQRVMVVGDLMLDQYVTGRTTRISPEAPVPVLEIEQEESRLGGAANVALNILALGATPVLCGVIGKDLVGNTFFDKMEEVEMGVRGIITSADRISTLKTRILAGKQQLLRLDKEQTHDLTLDETARFLTKSIELLDSEDITGLIFQDYNKGVLTPIVIETLIKEAKKRKIPVAVDPKYRNFWNYQGADLFKPNLKEVKDALRTPLTPTTASLKQATATIRGKIQCKITLITLSEQGIFMDDGDVSRIFPTKPRTVADVCGAGDTVISVAALALCVGLPAADIALLANLAGGQVVEKIGVVPVNRTQLREELLQIFLEA